MFENLDLGGIAAMAGLGGGALGVMGNVLVRGFIMQFVMRSLMTAAITGVGFMVLLDQLGFEIVRKAEVEEGHKLPDGTIFMSSPFDAQ